MHTMVRRLVEATLKRSYVRLVYPGTRPVIVRPETILRVDEHWQLLGHSMQKDRVMLFPLESLLSVESLA